MRFGSTVVSRVAWSPDCDAAVRCETLRFIDEPHTEPLPPPCPACGATLKYVDTEISSGAFRPQAAAMPQMSIHYYDCPACNTCWKLGTRLLPDPIRQILKS
jgi:hypothetical protein